MLAKKIPAFISLFFAFMVVSCAKEKSDVMPPDPAMLAAAQRAKFCKRSTSAGSIPEVKYLGKRLSGTTSFSELRDTINSACMNCHKVPSATGGITYTDSYQGQELTVGGVTKYYPGISEMAEKFAAAISNPNLEKRMPPPDRRPGNPDAFLKIGKSIEAWIAAGKPEGSFSLPGDGSEEAPQAAPLVNSAELGDCIPSPEIIGYDYRKDRFFANTQTLPKLLIDTDLFSLDAYVLAQKGTVAYNVEYPLWADNAEKGRWVHVPMKREGDRFEVQSIRYDAATKKFQIPDNTRFYKNFYKLVKQSNGKPRYRRVETRIIVVRTPWEKSLFGTYRWDDSEQVATLVETPYRDGSTFKDTVFKLVVDEKSGKSRTYAIPGRHRCLECHMGSESHSAILGFTPLQINRRLPGEFGRNPSITDDELSLADRLVQYRTVAGFQRGEELPHLEWIGNQHPRNIFEFRAQAYFVGNCAHCHNPDGFAFTKENGVKLELSPGSIFNFNTFQRSTQIATRSIVSSSGELERSHIYLKVADPQSAQGLTSRMPMHTPGTPDCNALRAIGKWVRSFESIQAAQEWEPECKAGDDTWLDQDFTWPSSDHYVPRRADWADVTSGMPEKYRNLQFSTELQDLTRSKFPVGFWNKKESCEFPPHLDLPKEQRRPWMMNGDKPKRPFGEVYYTTPGSWYFRTTCMKCHGPQADGNTALARGILGWSGGEVRVANLMDGLFGKKGENAKLFDATVGGTTRNLAGNYLIWMAMEGTRVKFPPEAAGFLGKHGGQMLNLVRDKCLRQISPDKASSPNFPDHEIYRAVCFSGNWAPNDPRLAFDKVTGKALQPEAVEEWLDRAAYNAGWAIFQYLKDASEGNWQPGNDECEKVFPK